MSGAIERPPPADPGHSAAEMREGPERIVEQAHLDACPGLCGKDLLQAFGEGVGAPDEVLEMDGVPRGLHVLDHARVELRRVLLDFYAVSPVKAESELRRTSLIICLRLGLSPSSRAISASWRDRIGESNGRALASRSCLRSLRCLLKAFPSRPKRNRPVRRCRGRGGKRAMLHQTARTPSCPRTRHRAAAAPPKARQQHRAIAS